MPLLVEILPNYLKDTSFSLPFSISVGLLFVASDGSALPDSACTPPMLVAFGRLASYVDRSARTRPHEIPQQTCTKLLLPKKLHFIRYVLHLKEKTDYALMTPVRYLPAIHFSAVTVKTVNPSAHFQQSVVALLP